MGILSAPVYFKLADLKTGKLLTPKGTVLVHRGRLIKEEVSKKFGNRQFYFKDAADGKVKCVSGGQLAYIIDQHSLDKTKEVKITYMGLETVSKGTMEGKDCHQFEVDLLNEEEDTALDPTKIKAVQDKVEEAKATAKAAPTAKSNLDDLE